MRRLLPALFAALALAGCSSGDDAPEHAPTIHVETADSSRLFGRTVEMPVSGLRYAIIAQPVVPEGNFISTEVYEVGEAQLRRKALLVQVDPKAAANLYTISTKAIDKRFFLLVDDKPVGVHLIVEPVRGGDIFFDVETPGADSAARDKAVFALRDRLNEAILKIRKAKQKK